MDLLQALNDALERRVGDLGVVRLEVGGVLLGRRDLLGRVVDDADPDAALLEPPLKVLVVGVVRLAEDEDGVDVVATQEERLVGRDRGRDAAELGGCDEDGGRKEGAEGVELRGARERRRVNTC